MEKIFRRALDRSSAKSTIKSPDLFAMIQMSGVNVTNTIDTAQEGACDEKTPLSLCDNCFILWYFGMC